MKLRRRAWLALFAASAALLGTSAPTPVFVSFPPTAASLPAGQMARFRVVFTPQSEGQTGTFLVMARYVGKEPAPAGAKLLLASSGTPDEPPLEIPLVSDSQVRARSRTSIPERPGEEDPSSTKVRPPPCSEGASCTTRYRAWVEPPVAVLLSLRRPVRSAPRTGIFPFDSPDVEGAREDEAERFQFHIEPTQPAPPYTPPPKPPIQAAPESQPETESPPAPGRSSSQPPHE